MISSSISISRSHANRRSCRRRRSSAHRVVVLLMCLRLETLLELFAGIVGAVDGVIET